MCVSYGGTTGEYSTIQKAGRAGKREIKKEMEKLKRSVKYYSEKCSTLQRENKELRFQLE